MAKTLLDVHHDAAGRVIGHSVLHSSEHDPTHSVVQTVEHDDHILDRNAAIRQAQLLENRPRVPLHDDADLRFAFSIPPLQWTILRQHAPEFVKALTKGDERSRTSAALELARLHPEWCIMKGRD